MKSEYYVATVVNAYRRAIDLLEKDLTNYVVPQKLLEELNKASHRNYTTGFYFGNENETRQNIETSAPTATHKFIALVLEDNVSGKVLLEQRNKFEVGDTLEVLSPSENFAKMLNVVDLENEEGEKVLVANQVQQKLYLRTDLPLKKGDMLRKEV